MRKFLLFLLLFVAGLGTLLYVQEVMKPVGAPLLPADTTQEAAPEDLLLVEDDEGDTEFVTGGALKHTERGRYTIEAVDHGPEGEGLYRLRDLEVTFLDEDTGEVAGRIEARAALVHMQAGEGGVSFDEAFGNELEDVVLHFLAGPPPSPVTMRLPAATASLERRELSSEAVVEITGVGLEATGVGLEAEAIAGSFLLKANPVVQLRLEDGSEAALSSTGPLQLLRRPELGEGEVELSVSEAAEFRWGGNDPLLLTADHIRVRGRLVDGAGGRFLPRSVEANGQVVLLPSEGRFTAQHGELAFDAEGQPLEAVLEREPAISVLLRGPGEEQREPLPLEASGRGPLILGLGELLTFDFAGPAAIMLPTLPLTVNAQGGLSGTRSRESGFGRLTTRGGATVQHGDFDLATESFGLEAFEDGAGETGVLLRTQSTARSNGMLKDGRPFALTARDGFVVLRSQDGFRIPEGRGIELSVPGPEGFAARADSVRDFDPDALEFLAEGHVVLENAQGQGTGDRLESFGVDRAELSGSDGAPAHLEFEGGSLEAGWIEYTETSVRAREDVLARFALQADRYELRADWMRLDRRRSLPGEERVPELTVDAGGSVRASADGADQRFVMSSRLLRLQAESADGSTAMGQLQPAFLLAAGDAHFEAAGEYAIEGWGDRLEILRDRTGRLYPEPDGRTRVVGVLPAEEIEFEMTAGIVEFSADRLLALDADLMTTSVPEAFEELPIIVSAALPGDHLRLVAGRMACDRSSILLTESAYIGQQSVGRPDWSVDAQNILVTADPAATTEESRSGVDALHGLLAWDGFEARAGPSMFAQGNHLQLNRETGILRIVGAPVVLGRDNMTWESNWFELNLRTAFMQSGPGSMISTSGDDGWALEYASLEPIESPDETIQIMREPRMTLGQKEVRASWALLWVDTREWSALSAEALDGTPASEASAPVQQGRHRPPHPDSLFGRLEQTEFGGWLREIYLEGNIELLDKGVRQVRADAIYLDRVAGHAWIKKFDLAVNLPIGREDMRLKLRADWLRHSADGSFRAESAVATTCDFEDPHYVVRFGDLQTEPRYRERPRKKNEPGPGDTVEEPDGWDVTSTDNSVTLGKYFVLPMPKMKVPVETDRSGGLKIDSDRFSMGGMQPINFGSDSKMGSFISTTFTTDLGFASRGLHRLLGGDSDGADLEGKTSIRPAYNNDRGVAVGVETAMSGEDLYELLLGIDLIEDDGKDRGLVRVPRADRERLRAWYRVRGRRLLGDKEWVDLVLTHQTDPGVQAEFFESEYVRFEERETYLHWRKARDPDYFSVTVEKNLDSFRSEVQEQPALNYARGRVEVANVRGVSVVYSSSTELSRMVREEGDVPTEPPFLDGFGEQDALRFDTTQRIEAPIPLGLLGLRAIPFLEGRATAWQIDSATGTGPLVSAEDPTRLALMGGATLATTLWRSLDSGTRHTFAPFVGVRADLALEGDSEPLVQFDSVENSLAGRFVDVGFRSYWVNPKRQSFFDLEVIETHATDAEGVAVASGWLPLRVHGSWFIPIAGMPFGISHDARYSIESSDTPYSRTQLGVEPIERLTLEAGYNSARNLAGQSIYNVMTAGAVLKLSPKWELEGNYGFSTQGDGRLSSDFEVRRIGHDFVFEISYRFQAGEGRSSLDYSISPLLGWKPANPSFLRRLHQSGG